MVNFALFAKSRPNVTENLQKMVILAAAEVVSKERGLDCITVIGTKVFLLRLIEQLY